MGRKRRLYSILVGRQDGRRPLGRPRLRWEDNIRRALREVGVRDENWLGIAQDRIQWRTFVTAAMNLRAPIISSTYTLTSVNRILLNTF